MLIMTHGFGDVVHIGPDIKLNILKIEGNKIVIGYTAPKEVTILRDKVKKRMEKREKEMAYG